MVESPVAGYHPVCPDIIIPALEKVMAGSTVEVKKLLAVMLLQSERDWLNRL
jgi:hypothetical protein